MKRGKTMTTERNKLPYNKQHTIIEIMICSIAVIASIYGMIRTMDGPIAFTYFTNLSNIMVDLALGIFLVLDIILLGSNGTNDKRSNGLYIFKFIQTICITLTFLIYFFFLAPTSGGHIHAYFTNYGGSFCVHFVTPVLAIIDFFLFDYRYESKKIHALYAILPPLCYVVYVVILGQVFGVRWDGTMMAPYNFINYGAPTGWFGFDLSQISSESLGVGVVYMFLVLLFIFIGIGQLYLFLKDLRRKKIMEYNQSN